MSPVFITQWKADWFLQELGGSCIGSSPSQIPIRRPPYYIKSMEDTIQLEKTYQ